MEQRWLEMFEQLSKQYYVNNVNVDRATFIFILESPHVQEVKFQVPVAGPSGKMMTKFLFNKQLELPLGRLMSELMNGNVHDPKLMNIGLLNVCNIPMQAGAYQPTDQEKYRELIGILEELRVKYQVKSYKNHELNDVRNMLLTMFKAQLEKLQHKKCFIIPCGKFASTYFEKAGIVGAEWNVVEGVPHPSRNQWYFEYEGLRALKQLFEESKTG